MGVSEKEGEGAGYGWSHIVVAVFSEAPSEDYSWCSIGKSFVTVVEVSVARVVDGVERLGAFVPLGGVFA